MSSALLERPASAGVPPVAEDEVWTGPEGESAVAVEFREEPLGEISALVCFESGSRAWLELSNWPESLPVLDGLCRVMDRYHLDELVLTPEFLAQWARWEAGRKDEGRRTEDEVR